MPTQEVEVYEDFDSWLSEIGKVKVEHPFVAATRIQESFVASVERRILVWLAKRTPCGINSDHLTALGFFGMLMAGLCYFLSRSHPLALLVGVFCLALNWLGDSLDGTLARVRNRQRPRYGFYVDHLLDTFSAFFLMGGLAFSSYIHPAIASGMLVTFLMLSIEVYLASYTLKTFRLSYGKLGPTEIRLLLAVGNIALLLRPVVHIFGVQQRLFDVGGLVAITAMAVMLVVSAAIHGMQLYREEQIRE
jgi:phosphatidylglycerophosphate synthase